MKKQKNFIKESKMQSRLKACGLNDYHVSKIQESSNNRLVDLGKSLLVMLDQIPDYDVSKAAEMSVRARISGVVASDDAVREQQSRVSSLGF